jgi:hypothetical protein
MRSERRWTLGMPPCSRPRSMRSQPAWVWAIFSGSACAPPPLGSAGMRRISRLPTYARGLAVCTRGACHNRAAAYDADLRSPGVVTDVAARVQTLLNAEDYAMVWDSLVLCKFIRDCFDDFYAEAAALWSAATGLHLDAGALRASAQRTWERKRRINARQGWTAADDVLPPRLATALSTGPYAGVAVDASKLAAARTAYERARSAKDAFFVRHLRNVSASDAASLEAAPDDAVYFSVPSNRCFAPFRALTDFRITRQESAAGAGNGGLHASHHRTPPAPMCLAERQPLRRVVLRPAGR